MLTRKQLSIVHVAKARTGMSDEDYRALLSRFDVETSKDLTVPQFSEMMAHFEGLGFRPATSFKRAVGSRERLSEKVKAIMADMGLKDAYVDGMARRMFKVDAWRWLSAQQLHKLVAALTYHQRRRDGR